MRNRKQKRATAQNQDEMDRYILVRKMDRTTYWGYSLSWYNLAGERAKWWDQIKRKGERKRQEKKQERKSRKNKERERKRHFTSFKVHSADNQALLWGHHPGTGSESGSPFPSTRPIIHPSFHMIRPKHSRRQELHFIFMQIRNTWCSIISCSKYIKPKVISGTTSKCKQCTWK